MFISAEPGKCSWKDFTLVIPAVSVGNVGQLAADLLISTLSMNTVGYFHDDSFLPVIGNDPFASREGDQGCKLVTAAAVYASAGHKLLVVQQRSPLIKGKKGQYVEKLMHWIKEQEINKVIILTSSFAHERTDKQLTGTQQRYIFSPKLEEECGSLVKDKLGWVALESRPPPLGTEAAPYQDLYIPGGGMAKGLYCKCSEEGVAVAVLLTFVAEGDNTVDGLQLATYLNNWQGWNQIKEPESLKVGMRDGWKIPSSWKLLFGSDFEQILFQ